MTTVLLYEEKEVIVHPDRMMVANGPNEGLLQALAKRLDRNTTAFKNNSRIHIPDGLPLKNQAKQPLRSMFSFTIYRIFSQVTLLWLFKQESPGLIDRNSNNRKDVGKQQS